MKKVTTILMKNTYFEAIKISDFLLTYAECIINEINLVEIIKKILSDDFEQTLMFYKHMIKSSFKENNIVIENGEYILIMFVFDNVICDTLIYAIPYGKNLNESKSPIIFSGSNSIKIK